MTEDIDFETYLNISQKKFEIYLFDKKKLNNLYRNELKFENNTENIDLNALNKFLEDNIFKIEKLIGKFVENIFLVIEDYRILNLNIGIKKKNYQQEINKNFLESTLTEAKDLFKETYQNYKIMHIIIKKYLINGKYYSSFVDDLNSNNLCIEVKFISIPSNLVEEIDKVLEKYQIKIVRYLNETYVVDSHSGNDSELPLMVNKILNGFNANEVLIKPKNPKKMGFFEKFFQLFS